LKRLVGLPLLTFLLGLLLAGCSHKPYQDQPIKPIWLQQNVHESWQLSHRYFIGFPKPEAFSVCHDLSCRSVTDTQLSTSEWQQIQQLFADTSGSPEQERKQIQQAVALMEKLVGEKVGTSQDLPQNALRGSRIGQLDCIDEATNTSVYLRILENQGLLQWHRTAPRTSRGIFIGRAPHNTATIVDLDTEIRYAVDAWYFDNGEPPAIVPLTAWKQGWRPESVDD
jgi:hypothetical protein